MTRRSFALTTPPVESSRFSPRPGIAALGGIAVYNVVQNLVIPDSAYVPANLAVSAGLVVLGRRAGVSASDMGLGRESTLAGVKTGVIAAAVVAGGIIASAAPSKLRALFLDERARDQDARDVAFHTMVRFPLGTALFEEVAFRGVLPALWKGSKLVSSAAFGAWHLLPTFRLYPGMGVGRNRPTTGRRVASAAAGAIVTGVAGFGFSALKERSSSVIAPWMAHTAYSVTAYLAARRVWRNA
jgi:membrane protease YdiL (CAAX protease family)